MKLLGKIVVILLAALMVAGATLALENSGALSSLTAVSYTHLTQNGGGFDFITTPVIIVTCSAGWYPASSG